MGGLDIAIAGCGVAGLAASVLLHDQGHHVTLYERFDEPRAVGSGLMIQPTGLAVLAEMGLADAIFASSAFITHLRGKNAMRETVLDARYEDLGPAGACGLGIHRASLFGALYDAVLAREIAVRTGHEVVGSELTGNRRSLQMAGGESTGSFDLVIDALGVASPLSSVEGERGWLPFGAIWSTLEWPEGGPFRKNWLEQRYDLSLKMAGVLPTGARRGSGRRELALFWSLRAEDYPRWLDEGLDRWKADFLRLWPECSVLLDHVTEQSRLTFARYAHRTGRQCSAPRLIHIGDSWHSASPQLGQGANMALLDALALARGLASGGSIEQRLAEANRLRQSHVTLYQRLTALLTPVYQSDHAFPAIVRDIVLAPLSRIWPGPSVQARLVSGLAGNPLEPLGLREPSYPPLL